MAFSWAKSISAGVVIAASEINELITNYNTTQNAVTFSPTYTYTFSPSSVSAGSATGKSIVEQLRSAINTLESKMSNNCNCANCCQTCQACQSAGCQTCQSCQSCQSQCTSNGCSCQGNQTQCKPWVCICATDN